MYVLFRVVVVVDNVIINMIIMEEIFTKFSIFPITAKRRWRRSHVRIDWREFHSQPSSLVRRCRKWNDVSLSRIHALRRSGHFTIPKRMALGPSTHPSSGQLSSQRRSHLRHRTDLHVHPRTGSEAALPFDGRHHEVDAHEQRTRTRTAPRPLWPTGRCPTATARNVTFLIMSLKSLRSLRIRSFAASGSNSSMEVF